MLANMITIMLCIAARKGMHAGIAANVETNLLFNFEMFPKRKIMKEPAMAETPSSIGFTKGFASVIRV